MSESNRQQGGTTADVAARTAATCKNCGSTDTVRGPGAGPHHARLLCAGCGTFIKWLKKPAGPGNTRCTDDTADWLSMGLEPGD